MGRGIQAAQTAAIEAESALSNAYAASIDESNMHSSASARLSATAPSGTSVRLQSSCRLRPLLSPLALFAAM